ncbi:hypothetical protein [Blastococcus sp. TF02A-26]|uniref:hypothetical protein n=1 Tax=Blastococcus sp. TF02A-26 TaxID=2250577 RepID=UPI000DE8EA40|nr:hypothetical protein [Blastococcus sp. TF02A-26]RBY86115.1 hypothetical protein DQ240_09890 [Blastococcus sp. TF02A-26]
MADGTEVVPEAVRTFGRSAMEQGPRFTEAVQGAAMPVLGANLGASGASEARAAAGAHSAAAEAAAAYIADVGSGLLALSYTAATVAANYEAGDTSQQAQMASVQGSFTPPPGTPTIASQQAAAEQAAAAEAARLARLERQMGLPPGALSQQREPSWTDDVVPVPSTGDAEVCEVDPFTAAQSQVESHYQDLAELNGDDRDDWRESDAVRDEQYDPAAEQPVILAPGPLDGTSGTSAGTVA